MSLWRSINNELSGAWRSLRYDLDRRSVRARDLGSADRFAGTPPPSGRPPRRFVAISAIGVVALIGAAGSGLAVVNGLGPLPAEEPAAPQSFPLVAEAAPRLTAPTAVRTTRKARSGRPAPTAPAPKRRRTAVAATPVRPTTEATVPAPVARPLPRIRITPTTPHTFARPPSTPCVCTTPPMSAPTSPSSQMSPTGHPSITPSPFASSSATPEPHRSDTPSDEPSSDHSGDVRIRADVADGT